MFSVEYNFNQFTTFETTKQLVSENIFFTLLQNKLEITIVKQQCFSYPKMFSMNAMRSHGLVVKADGLQPRGCEFKPWHGILIGS